MQRMQCGVLDARVSEAWKWRLRKRISGNLEIPASTLRAAPE